MRNKKVIDLYALNVALNLFLETKSKPVTVYEYSKYEPQAFTIWADGFIILLLAMNTGEAAHHDDSASSKNHWNKQTGII